MSKEFASYLVNNYKPAPIEFVAGKGARLKDSEGQDYIDFSSGIAVSLFGHNYPPLSNALARQSQRLLHMSNLFMHNLTLRVAKKLVRATGMKQVFFSNSGAEANEAALKLARKRGVALAKNKYKVISLSGSFHGRIGLALAASAQPQLWKDFGPQPAGFIHVPHDDEARIRNAFDGDVCAAIIEPIQGERGLRQISLRILKLIEAQCKKHNALLIVDEIQTGMGRTGNLLASKACRLKPDVLTLGKGIGGGFPVGAMLIGPKAKGVFKPGDHGTTYGGNALACAAVEVVVDKVARPAFLAKVRAKARLLETGLVKIQKAGAPIAALRGSGLLRGLELDSSCTCQEMSARTLHRGVLTVPAGENVLRVLPPLNITKSDLAAGLRGLRSALLET